MENVYLRDNESPAETYAFALVVFSIVPYLGILFSLPALAIAAISIVTNKTTKTKARTNSGILFAGGAILLVQVILWSLLYFPPDSSR